MIDRSNECENEKCWRDKSDMCNQCREIEQFPRKAQALIKSIEQHVNNLTHELTKALTEQDCTEAEIAEVLGALK